MSTLFRTAQDPISSEPHALGAVLSLLGGFVFVFRALRTGASVRDLAGAAVFTLSLIPLYAASAIYPYYPGAVHSGGAKRRPVPYKTLTLTTNNSV